MVVGQKNQNVCIIGGGPTGLYALQQIKKLPGFTGTIFERGNGIGGVWRYTKDKGQPVCSDPFPTPMYHNLITNGPKWIGTYQDVAWKEGTPMYPTKEEHLEYLTDFVKEHGLESNIKCNHEVILVEPLDPKDREGTQWSVTVKDWGQSERVTKKYTFDKVMICTGYTIRHNTPNIPGLGDYEGLLINAAQYNKSEIFKGMRVLLIGGGASAIDLLFDLSKVAADVILCKKASPYSPGVLPPNGRIVQSSIVGATKNGFVLEDGTRTEKIDGVVICTGYEYAFDFLAPSCKIQVSKKQINHLYRHLVNVKYPGLFFPGICEYVPALYSSSLQIKWILKVLQGSLVLPSEEAMMEDIQAERQYLVDNAHIPGNFPDKPHFLQTRQFHYFQTLAQEGSFKVTPWVEPIYKICLPRIFEDNAGFRRDNYEIIDDKVVKVQMYRKGSIEVSVVNPLEVKGVSV